MSRPKWHSFNTKKVVVLVGKGKYKGAYDCFTDVDSFHFTHPGKEVKPWYEGEKDDWVVTTDGWVVQVIRTYIMAGKNGSRKQVTKVIFTCLGSSPYYKRKDGTSNSQMLASHYINRKGKMKFGEKGRGSMAGSRTPRHGVTWNTNKQKFARLLLKGYSPATAYAIVWGEMIPSRAERRAMLVIKHHKDDIMSMIQTHYKELFDSAGMTDSDIAVRLVEMANNNRSPHAALEAIKTILVLRGEAAVDVNIKGGNATPPIAVTPPYGAASLSPATVTIEEEPEIQDAVVVSTTPSSPNPSQDDDARDTSDPEAGSSDDSADARIV